MSGRLKSFSGSMQDACKVILQEIVPNYWDSVSFGESMIFLKRAEPMVLLNECRENKLVETAVLLCRVSWRLLPVLLIAAGGTHCGVC